MTNFVGRRPRPISTFIHTRGFTLVELIIVIILLGILSVYAAPRIFSGAGVAESGAEARILALLRLQQQSAMQDTTNACYGVRITSNSIAPYNCAQAFEADRVIEMPDGVTVATIPANVLTLSGGLLFNALGCPVIPASLPTDTADALALTSQPCSGSGAIQINIVSSSPRQVCIQSQGYIRSGAC